MGFRSRIHHRAHDETVQIVLPPDAGGAATSLGGSHDLQRRHLAAQMHEEGHRKACELSLLIHLSMIKITEGA